MPGLAFLGKKSWHTSNLKNVEQVWLAEQKASEETKKLDELKKQITEERQIMELRQLQVASGQAVKHVDTTLDWMYEGPSAHQEQSAEEYLLGKIYKPSDNEKTDIHKMSKDPGSLWLNKVSSKNDTFTRLHEDPLLEIKQNEIKACKLVLNNPVKMSRIQQQIALDLEKLEREKQEKKRLKKEKKELKKKEKNKKSKKSHSRSESPSNGRVDDGHRRASSVNIHHSNGSSSYATQEMEQDMRRKSSGDAFRHGGYSNGHEKYSNLSVRRSRSRSRGRDPRQASQRHDAASYSGRSRGTSSDEEEDDRATKRRRYHSESESGSDNESDRNNSNKSSNKYGLINKGKGKSSSSLSSSSGPTNHKDLGPSGDLIAKKLEREREEQLKRNQQRGGESSKKLSEEERQRRLREMEDNANMFDSMRSSRLQRNLESSSSSKVDERDKDEKAHVPDAKFLNEMRSGVYNSGDISMEDRLSRNKHYHQRGTDLDSHGFMIRKG